MTILQDTEHGSEGGGLWRDQDQRDLDATAWIIASVEQLEEEWKVRCISLRKSDEKSKICVSVAKPALAPFTKKDYPTRNLC